MKRICIITMCYPTPKSPAQFAFVDELACAMADRGVQIDVITPTPYGKKKSRGHMAAHWERKTPQGNVIHVYQPMMLRVSDRTIGQIKLGSISDRNFYRAVRKTLLRLPKPDALYSHFLNPAGIAAAKLGKELGVPSFCAFGESSLWTVERIGLENATAQLSQLAGIVAVSSENKRLLSEAGIYPAEKIGVFPNSADHTVFYPRDKAACRKALGLPQDAVIGMFTGAWEERKGPLRVQQAALRIPGLKMIYAGSGAQIPEGDNVLFKGRIAHEKLPEYLSAADFFVLPTLAEGCCNAIVEAMACGLPVISSEGSFNDDILNEINSIRIDPMDVEALHAAMKRLTEDAALRERLAEGAAEMTQQLDIAQRAANILHFMENA